MRLSVVTMRQAQKGEGKGDTARKVTEITTNHLSRCVAPLDLEISERIFRQEFRQNLLSARRMHGTDFALPLAECPGFEGEFSACFRRTFGERRVFAPCSPNARGLRSPATVRISLGGGKVPHGSPARLQTSNGLRNSRQTPFLLSFAPLKSLCVSSHEAVVKSSRSPPLRDPIQGVWFVAIEFGAGFLSRFSPQKRRDTGLSGLSP